MNISPQRLKELEAIPEDAIDTDQIPELDDSFWSKAKMVAPRTKFIFRRFDFAIVQANLQLLITTYKYPVSGTANSPIPRWRNQLLMRKVFIIYLLNLGNAPA